MERELDERFLDMCDQLFDLDRVTYITNFTQKVKGANLDDIQ